MNWKGISPEVRDQSFILESGLENRKGVALDLQQELKIIVTCDVAFSSI